MIIEVLLNCSGFSVIDLVEDRHSRRLYALKRVSCHSRDDEKHAIHEVELMNAVHHRSLVPCEAHAVVPITGHSTAVSEVLIVMPYYKVMSAWVILFHVHICLSWFSCLTGESQNDSVLFFFLKKWMSVVHNDNKKLSSCCVYDVQHSYRALSGLAIVSMSINLFTVSNWSLFLMLGVCCWCLSLSTSVPLVAKLYILQLKKWTCSPLLEALHCSTQCHYHANSWLSEFSFLLFLYLNVVANTCPEFCRKIDGCIVCIFLLVICWCFGSSKQWQL